MLKLLFFLPAILFACAFFISTDQAKKILVTKENYVTSEAGDKMAEKPGITFVEGEGFGRNHYQNPSFNKQNKKWME